MCSIRSLPPLLKAVGAWVDSWVGRRQAVHVEVLAGRVAWRNLAAVTLEGSVGQSGSMQVVTPKVTEEVQYAPEKRKGRRS